MSTTKSNKSFLKRFKTTKKSGLKSRVPGKNHYNAKMSGSSLLKKRRKKDVKLSNKTRSRFLPHS